MVFAVVKALDATLKAHSKLVKPELPADQTVRISPTLVPKLIGTTPYPRQKKADLRDIIPFP